MGKKYIIELEEPEMFDEQKYYQCSQMPWWSVSENIVENLTPYTEPDLEQVKCEAYEEGRNSMLIEVQKAGKNKIKLEEDEYYQRGLSDAWEAARKIWEYDTTTLKAIFGEGIMRMDWFMRFTASEAIEKIRQYEQEKEEEIQVGDEVIATSGKAVIVGINDDKDKARYIYPDSTLGFDNICNLSKTGRHFPEIAEVLQKMQGEQDG